MYYCTILLLSLKLSPLWAHLFTSKVGRHSTACLQMLDFAFSISGTRVVWQSESNAQVDQVDASPQWVERNECCPWWMYFHCTSLLLEGLFLLHPPPWAPYFFPFWRSILAAGGHSSIHYHYLFLQLVFLFQKTGNSGFWRSICPWTTRILYVIPLYISPLGQIILS